MGRLGKFGFAWLIIGSMIELTQTIKERDDRLKAIDEACSCGLNTVTISSQQQFDPAHLAASVSTRLVEVTTGGTLPLASSSSAAHGFRGQSLGDDDLSPLGKENQSETGTVPSALGWAVSVKRCLGTCPQLADRGANETRCLPNATNRKNVAIQIPWRWGSLEDMYR